VRAVCEYSYFRGLRYEPRELLETDRLRHLLGIGVADDGGRGENLAVAGLHGLNPVARGGHRHHFLLVVDVTPFVRGDEVDETPDQMLEVFARVVGAAVVAGEKTVVGQNREVFGRAHEVAGVRDEDGLGLARQAALVEHLLKGLAHVPDQGEKAPAHGGNLPPAHPVGELRDLRGQTIEDAGEGAAPARPGRDTRLRCSGLSGRSHMGMATRL
jgi:hypothetical protein